MPCELFITRQIGPFHRSALISPFTLDISTTAAVISKQTDIADVHCKASTMPPFLSDIYLVQTSHERTDFLKSSRTLRQRNLPPSRFPIFQFEKRYGPQRVQEEI